MVGAPGIGKTAIMQQIASELGIALVSYSMTHHTRQSALGLPVIEERDFEGKQDSGKKEGILFLDEINCVSETLALAMLLFLQYLTAIQMLKEYQRGLEAEDVQKDFEKVKKQFDREVKRHEKGISEVQSMREASFAFIKGVWGNGQEMVFF